MPRILVVEDNPDMRTLVTRYVETLGYEWQAAENGLVALEMVRKSPIDVVLCDVQMPEMDGIAFVKQFKAIAPHVPVIMLSAQKEIETVVECIRSGALDYIQKEKVVEELEATLTKAIDRRQSEMVTRTLRENMRSLHHLFVDLKRTVPKATMAQMQLFAKIEAIFNRDQ